jgi:uncharacterized delta-60 repeat protein
MNALCRERNKMRGSITRGVRTRRLAATLLFTLIVPAVAFAAGGDLDATFDGDGTVTTNFTNGRDFAAGAAIQTDGKIVVAGRAGTNGSSGGRFALARYNDDGTLDATFSGDGLVATDFTAVKNDEADEVAIQGDGKIVAAGVAGNCCIGPDGAGRFALARYNADGTLDTTFSGDGKRTTKLTTGNDYGAGLAIQGDGKIIAAGRAGGYGGRFALVRYNTDGTLDTTFSGDGKLMTNLTTGNDFVMKLAIQANGKIVAAGRAGGRFGLARYNANGTLDSTFSADGKLTTDFTGGFDMAVGLALQSDGKIVAGGEAGDGSAGSRFALARYGPTGGLDTTFGGGDGKVITDFFAGEDDFAAEVAIQTDGKIVAIGFASGTFAVVRYSTDGTLDSTFSGDGKVFTEITPEGSYGLGGTIQGDGKIVAVGLVFDASGDGGKFGVVRYLAG